MLATDRADLADLIGAVARQDRTAFRQLYDLSAPKLFATILRIVRSRPAAEEVLQDVFLRIWQSAATYSPQIAPAAAWLNSIARNRAIDVLRQKNFALLSSAEGETDWFERLAEDRDREADMINNSALRHCLGEMDENARTCVLLAYYEGFSREELAVRFNRPVNTIKTWLHRTLTSLRACLDGNAA